MYIYLKSRRVCFAYLVVIFVLFVFILCLVPNVSLDCPASTALDSKHGGGMGCRGHDRMVVGFITTYAVSTDHH